MPRQGKARQTAGKGVRSIPHASEHIQYARKRHAYMTTTRYSIAIRQTYLGRDCITRRRPNTTNPCVRANLFVRAHYCPTPEGFLPSSAALPGSLPVGDICAWLFLNQSHHDISTTQNQRPSVPLRGSTHRAASRRTTSSSRSI